MWKGEEIFYVTENRFEAPPSVWPTFREENFHSISFMHFSIIESTEEIFCVWHTSSRDFGTAREEKHKIFFRGEFSSRFYAWVVNFKKRASHISVI